MLSGVSTAVKVAVAGTIAGGVVLTGIAWNGEGIINDTMNKLSEQASALTQFKGNETKLVAKVNELKETRSELLATIEAKNGEITKLEGEKKVLEDKVKELEATNSAQATEITNLKSRITNLNKQITALQRQVASLAADLKQATDDLEAAQAENVALENEVLRLQGELEKANNDVVKLQQHVDSMGTVTPDQSAVDNALQEEVVEDVLVTDVVVKNDGPGRTYVSFVPQTDIDLSLATPGNVVLKFKGANGEVLKEKNNTWAGYLNDAQGNKYGKSINIPANKYSNTLTAGVKYSNVLTGKEGVTSVELTIVKAEGQSQTVTMNVQ